MVSLSKLNATIYINNYQSCESHAWLLQDYYKTDAVYHIKNQRKMRNAYDLIHLQGKNM
jgi:hypothetical protein